MIWVTDSLIQLFWKLNEKTNQCLKQCLPLNVLSMAASITKDFKVEANPQDRPWRIGSLDTPFALEIWIMLLIFILHLLIPVILARWLVLNPPKIAPSELKQMEREISLFQKPKAILQEVSVQPMHANEAVMVSSEVVQNVTHGVSLKECYWGLLPLVHRVYPQGK